MKRPQDEPPGAVFFPTPLIRRAPLRPLLQKDRGPLVVEIGPPAIVEKHGPADLKPPERIDGFGLRLSVDHSLYRCGSGAGGTPLPSFPRA
jgi:hypothetical protein